MEIDEWVNAKCINCKAYHYRGYQSKYYNCFSGKKTIQSIDKIIDKIVLHKRNNKYLKYIKLHHNVFKST